MTRYFGTAFALGIMVTLAACNAPRSENYLAQPPEGAESAPSASDAGADTTGPVLSVPSSSNLGIEETAPATDDGKAEAIIVLAPDGSRWKAPGARSGQQRADAESCYTYAQAVTRRETQLTDDRDAAVDNLNSDSRFSFLRSTVRGYDSKRREGNLMESCMSGKGYLQL